MTITVKHRDIVPGRRYRITQASPGYSIIHEGIVATRSDDLTTVLFVGAARWTAVVDDGDRVVTIEALPEPLPTRPDSVIRVTPPGEDPRVLVLGGDGFWRSGDGFVFIDEDVAAAQWVPIYLAPGVA